MTLDTTNGLKHYIADEGKCFVQKDDSFTSTITEIWLSGSDDILNYVEINIPEDIITEMN